MKKRFLSAVLAVILCVSLASPAFAAEIGHEGAVRQMAAREIESETARMLSGVAVQLEAQGQLDMLPIYEEILTAEIEARVAMKYGISTPASSESISLSFPNGGAIGYDSAFYTSVLKVYMTKELFDEYAQDNVYVDAPLEIEVGNLVPLLGANLASWFIALSIPSTVKVIADLITCEEIYERGGYAEVMVVSDMAGIETSTSLLVWYDYPNAVFVPYNDDYVWEAF